MSILVCGSMAYDTIMVFEDTFQNHILPDKVHKLNVAFLVPRLERHFGGCAGNIAYNLKLLETPSRPVASVGRDFDLYADRLDELGIDQSLIKRFDDSFTAQAYITTDLEDNQITAFHPGAMNLAHANRVIEVEDVELGIVAPDGKQAMLQHAEDFATRSVPFIFDPGQGLPMFDGEELTRLIEQASYLTVNDYEAELIKNKTGMDEAAIANRLEALIVTLGASGSKIYRNGATADIPAAKARQVVDPTGCGDAYRAGLLFGLIRDLPLETAAQIASLMGTIKIEHQGTQNHSFTLDEFGTRYEDTFGASFSSS